MRGKTILASIVTLMFLGMFVFATFVAISVAASGLDLVPALAIGTGLTIVWSAFIWLVSPFIMDLVQRWAYKSRNITLEELGQQRPAVAQFVWNVTQKHGIAVPKLKLIDDMTPQAYCYGSYANNSRLVVTNGLFHYLDDEELKAVYAHELGHIVHRDFIVMTIAATLLSILWNAYVIAKSIRGKNNSRPGMPIAVVAWVFWWLGTYLLLYLSRTREYYADEFAATETGNPNALSMALVKIAYGITAQPQTPFAQKLMGGTRALGISDFKMAAGPGQAFAAVNARMQYQQQQQGGYAQPAYAGAGGTAGASAYASPQAASYEGVRHIEKVFLFDLYNPWATVCELASTHPLTGKRIRALGEHAQSHGQAPLMSFDRIDAQGQQLDMGRMYGNFFFEVTIYYLPQILGLLFGLAAVAGLVAGQAELAGLSAGGIVFGIGVGMTIKGMYRYRSIAGAVPTTVLELMSDAYASPLRGKPVILQGTVIGKADAGGRLGEDMTLQDNGGGLIMLNYESAFGFLGNWWFGLKRVARLIGQPVQVTGWFRRNVSQLVDLKTLQTANGETIGSWTAFWGRVGGIFVLALGAIIAAVAVAAMTQG